ncbi:hypothetical protein [Pelomonas sp. SE-A7]|uniref:hypothetical protein n=1 Tax=Pelomonas sp. SE-A7 TaxID=3054953 RepID=UPI00338E6523
MSKTKPATAAAKPPKADKPKLVRDSFTMPKGEYEVIDLLKQRLTGLGRTAKKSELLRAGIAALQGLADKALLKALEAVPSLKTGRPKAEPVAEAKPADQKPVKPAKPAKPVKKAPVPKKAAAPAAAAKKPVARKAAPAKPRAKA